MLQNAYLLAKIGADTAENERNFAEILPKIGNYPTCPCCAAQQGEIRSGGLRHADRPRSTPDQKRGVFGGTAIHIVATVVSSRGNRTRRAAYFQASSM